VFDVETSDFFPTAYTPAIEFSAALVEQEWQLANGDGRTGIESSLKQVSHG
jgi:hypothetical protein